MSPLANRVESFDVTIAASTQKQNATTTDVSFQDGIVTRVELDIPAGHAGLTGIQILSAKGQFIPYTFGEFLVGDNHNFGWDVVGAIDTGSFQVRAFNLDAYAHTFHLRFSVLDFAYAPSTTPLAPLPPTPLLV